MLWWSPRIGYDAPDTDDLVILFNSNSIVAGGYDACSGTLRLRYIDGDTYDYRNVPSAVFDDLLDAP